MDERRTVLLVEDDEIIRLWMTNVLQRRGHVVLDAPSGAEGLARARENGSPIDVLVTDVSMKSMNGFDLAAHVLELWPQARVVYVSGTDQRDALLSSPAQDAQFLRKPFTGEALVRLVTESPQ